MQATGSCSSPCLPVEGEPAHQMRESMECLKAAPPRSSWKEGWQRAGRSIAHGSSSAAARRLPWVFSHLHTSQIQPQGFCGITACYSLRRQSWLLHESHTELSAPFCRRGASSRTACARRGCSQVRSHKPHGFCNQPVLTTTLSCWLFGGLKLILRN